MLQQNLDIVPMLPEACSLAACLNLTAQLTCIANAIVNGDPVALQKCLTTSMTQVCYISSYKGGTGEANSFDTRSARVLLVSRC